MIVAEREGAGATLARLARVDYVLAAAIGALLLVGLDMVYSASFVIAHNSPEFGSDTYFLTRQLLWIGLGGAALVVTSLVDYRHWRRVSVVALLGVIALLVAVVTTKAGHDVYGAQRWIKLGPLPPVQPSEFVKLAIVLYFADWLSKRRDRLGSFLYGVVPFAILVVVIAGLVMLQPDLGSTFVILSVAGAMFFLAGARLWHLGLGLIIGAASIALLTMGASYRLKRVAAFLDPEADPLGIGWHISQSAIALGSGGLFGRGLGASRQKFYYLPNAHTDAIFPVIGEELGFVGALLVIALFGVLGYRGYQLAMRVPDAYGALIAVGITFWLVGQALINIGVVTATLPFTGIPLPFVSFGGSSLIISMAAVGILLNISRHVEASRREPAHADDDDQFHEVVPSPGG